MSRITPLINAYRHHLTVPWPAGLAAIQRVIFAVYDKADELRLRTHIGEFDQATQQTGRCWLLIDLTDAFPEWMATQEYREAYFACPEDLEGYATGQLTEFVKALIAHLKQRIEQEADDRTMVALLGVGALFGVASSFSTRCNNTSATTPRKRTWSRKSRRPCASYFTGRLLFVGTGQSALSGTPNLQRLMARFPVPVMLGDWDVENVTRQIILAKKPSAQPEIERVWRANLGEISRQLRGTKLEHVTDDEAVLTADYPLLPVRRRFWERVAHHRHHRNRVATAQPVAGGA